MITDTRLRLFQVDAFSGRPFAGNPAAVVPLDDWPPATLLQAIAAENNLAETAYIKPAGSDYEIRWFTPTAEVKLCGHATLASAFVLFNCLGHAGDEIGFQTRHSGRVGVTREGSWLYLDFPAYPAEPVGEPSADLLAGLGAMPPGGLFQGPNFLAVYDSEQQVRDLTPDMRALARLPDRCVIATAPADEPGLDFVSRFFAPNFGIDEDPVTGSAHCMLAPYWGQKLGKTALAARQISARGGELSCELVDGRVRIGGRAVLYLQGEIYLPKEA